MAAVTPSVKGEKGKRMGKATLKHQIDKALDSLMVPGLHKGEDNSKIRSYSTLENYRKECQAFASWVRERHPGERINTLEKLRPYAEEYLTRSKPTGEPYSAWTICKERAAIAKLYGEDCRSILKDAPERTRDDIKRSRGKDWAEIKPIDKQPDYEALGRAAGLRKADFSRVKKEDIEQDSKGRVIVHIDKGKGGKPRYIVCLPEYADRVLALRDRTSDGERIIPAGMVPNRFDEHACRRYYANEMYRRLARPIEDIPRSERYYCRDDRKGIVLDRRAMARVSMFLGHGSRDPKTGKWRDRVSVIAISYLQV